MANPHRPPLDRDESASSSILQSVPGMCRDAWNSQSRPWDKQVGYARQPPTLRRWHGVPTCTRASSQLPQCSFLLLAAAHRSTGRARPEPSRPARLLRCHGGAAGSAEFFLRDRGENHEILSRRRSRLVGEGRWHGSGRHASPPWTRGAATWGLAGHAMVLGDDCELWLDPPLG